MFGHVFFMDWTWHWWTCYCLINAILLANYKSMPRMFGINKYWTTFKNQSFGKKTSGKVVQFYLNITKIDFTKKRLVIILLNRILNLCGMVTTKSGRGVGGGGWWGSGVGWGCIYKDSVLVITHPGYGLAHPYTHIRWRYTDAARHESKWRD